MNTSGVTDLDRTVSLTINRLRILGADYQQTMSDAFHRAHAEGTPYFALIDDKTAYLCHVKRDLYGPITYARRLYRDVEGVP